MNKMNKFYKTSYSKRNDGNFLKSHNFIDDYNQIKDFGTLQKVSTQLKRQQHDRNIRLHNVIQNKIEIDPSLLFNHKSNLSRNSNYPTTENQKKAAKKYLMSSTSKQRFYQNNQRPQSKKQSRVRLWSRQSSTEKKQAIKQKYDRPQTSKGQRRTVQTRQSHTQQEYNGRILLNSRNQKTRVRPHSTTGANSSKIALNTSLDPDFLALFAN